ncbi:VPLPA-CTERM sorting domain-containing protein [Pacificoceanicola onchidii]|uniref:VPLPA-CTERM sorting domain-containing protein n=1 Tax=Pacificoceanicola onchidii TaxID=2562685 RepID=UPI0010A51F9F|nr:VPLPA-CTERM sorting domain-containing protein [Pacificoceanicola onchidii]
MMISRFFAPLLAAATFASAAPASVVVNITEDGSDLVMQVTGSLNTDSLLKYFGSFSNYGSSFSTDYFGIRTQSYNFYDADLSGGVSYTLSPTRNTLFNTGDTFWFNHDGETIGLATTYVSGSAISSSARFTSGSLATLGPDLGSYVWTLGNGETITLNVGISPVPLPAGGLLLAGALAALGLRKRRKTA